MVVVEAAFTDGGDPLDQIFGHGGFALDAADGGGGAALADPVEAAGIAFGRGEEFVPVEDGADIGIAGVDTALACGVGDHDFGFFADVVVGFGEGDGVAVGLGHFAAVEPGDAGGWGKENLRFLEHRVGEEKAFAVGGEFFKEIGNPHFVDFLTRQHGENGALLSSELMVCRNDRLSFGKFEHFVPDRAAEFAIGDRKDFGIDVETVVKIEATDEFAGELDVGDLVFADWDEEALAGMAIHDDVGGLQGGIAEEAVGVQIFVLDVVELLFVGGDALKPAEWGDHREEEVEFGVFGDEGLQENRGFIWIEA